MLILGQREMRSGQQSLNLTQETSQPQVEGEPLQSPLVQQPVLPAAWQEPISTKFEIHAIYDYEKILCTLPWCGGGCTLPVSVTRKIRFSVLKSKKKRKNGGTPKMKI